MYFILSVAYSLLVRVYHNSPFPLYAVLTFFLYSYSDAHLCTCVPEDVGISVSQIPTSGMLGRIQNVHFKCSSVIFPAALNSSIRQHVVHCTL